MYEFESAAVEFAVNQESRTLTGTILPFGVVSRPAADPNTGKTARFQFSEGSVLLPKEITDVVLNYGHDRDSLTAQVGVATRLEITPEGVQGTFRIARTPEGDRVLALAEDRILKSFSAEVEGDFDPDNDGVQHAKESILTGAAVVRKPAFVGASITSVAASAADNEETPMSENETNGNETEVSFSALEERVNALVAKVDEMSDIKVPVETAQFSVKEEPIYRFSGSVGAPSGFDFATDMKNAALNGDAAALKRVQDFTAAQFVETGDVNELFPAQYQPGLFLGQAPVPTSPLFDTFSKGAPPNGVNPFFWSKLDRAATNVGVANHTEGVNPADGTLATTSGTTVTPQPVSGQVHITRDVSDAAPQISAMVWAEFDRSYRISLETRTAALLAASAGSYQSLTAAIAAGADGADAGAAIEAGLVGLQFRADGGRFTKAFGHVDLYTALATYENADGEKRYPIINPQNRDGVSGAKYSFLDIAGYRMEPAHSLGATSGSASNSYVVDPGAVHVWNTGIQRLDKLQESVEGWDLGVFGYFAGLVWDESGVLKIAYDPTA